jgi:uncharacterized protein (TIRG00374 family)
MAAADEASVPVRSWRSRIPAPLRHSVTIFLALLVVEYLVIPKFVAASHAVALIDHVNIVFLVLAVLLEGSALFAYALLTKVLLPPDAPGIGTLFRIDLATTAIAHIVPGGSAASATLGYRLFTRLGVDGRSAGFAMATQGLGSALVLNILLWGSLVISIPFAGVHPIYASVALVGVLALLAVAALVFAFTRGEEGAVHVVRSIGRRLPRISEERVESIVRHIGDSLRELWRNRAQLRLAIVWAAVNWLLDAACLWSFLAAFHRYVNPVELFAAYGIGNVLAVLPITPGGLGVIEATTIFVLKSFGVAYPIALEAVIGWRLINFWLPIPVGAGCYISLRAQLGQGRGVRRAALSAMVAESRTDVAPGATTAPPPTGDPAPAATGPPPPTPPTTDPLVRERQRPAPPPTTRPAES